MSKCPLNHQNCQNNCALMIANKGCALAITHSVQAENAKAIYEQGRALENIALELAEANELLRQVAKLPAQEEAPAKEQSKREETQTEIEHFCRNVNPLEIANTPTAEIRKVHDEWCAKRNVIPCSPQKLTMAICKEHALETEKGVFRAIRKTIGKEGK